MKKLVTVCWSTTVEVDMPDGISEHDLVAADFRSPLPVQEFAVKILKEAYANIGQKDGEITDVQDVDA